MRQQPVIWPGNLKPAFEILMFLSQVRSRRGRNTFPVSVEN